MAQIAKLGIGKTQKLLKEQGFAVDITNQALSVLAEDGYDPVYGARPLRRLIQSSVENPVALSIIGKQFAPGDTIIIDYDGAAQKFIFKKGAPQHPVPGQEGAPQTAVPGVPMNNAQVDPNAVQQPNSMAQPGQQPIQQQPVQQPPAPAPQPVQEPYYGMPQQPQPPMPEQAQPGVLGTQPPVQPIAPVSPYNGNGMTMSNGAANTTAVN